MFNLGKTRPDGDPLMKALATLREVDDAGTLTTEDLMGSTAHDAVRRALDDIEDAPAPSSYRRLRNSAWRMLEEQRMHALDIVGECDEAIRALQDKREDALAAASACEQAQKTLDPS